MKATAVALKLRFSFGFFICLAEKIPLNPPLSKGEFAKKDLNPPLWKRGARGDFG
jgi:hypothetical protein